ncbi:MAG: hypothetical protein K8R69_09335 [Deltaproteobacteria bacterium]|nr:hypothetical protein [Deltaproteobacteria bacterium]
MSPPRPSLDQVAVDLALTSHALTQTGRLLFESLEKPMNSLKAGRSPRALALSETVEKAGALRGTLAEILNDFQSRGLEFKSYESEWKDPNFAVQMQALEGELRFWTAFHDRSQILLKKLQLIAELENLSALGRAPIQDAWDEMRALAMAESSS